MEQAILLAKQAEALGETPVGCVIVRQASGEIIGRGYNRRETDRSPLRHAELLAIEEAAKALGGWRLSDTAIYVTLEPCMMCLGAILQSRPQLLVYGASDKNGMLTTGKIQTPFACRSGILHSECQNILQVFFQNKRSKISE